MDRSKPVISFPLASKAGALRKGNRSFELFLTSIVAAANFAVSLYIAPMLSIIIPKVFLGAFIMVPLNLCLSSFVWATTKKKMFTIYFVIYGLLAMPTTIWGSTPGVFKPLLGAAIGVSLDLITDWLKPEEKKAKYIVGVIFPLIWWALTGITWAVVGLPIVQIFQAMLGSVPALKPIAQMGFAMTFVTIALITIPSSVVAIHLAVMLSNRVKRDLPIP